MYAKWDFHSYMWGRRDEEMQRRRTEKGSGDGGKGWEGWREDDRGADWPKGLLSPPAMPSVHVRPNSFVTLLTREDTSHNALCLCVPQSQCMSGVHLFCIKVSGKDATGVSRLACSSLKGYHQMRARGCRDMADDCIFYRGGGCGCTAGWHNTPGSQSKPAQKQTTPISPVPLDASQREVTQAPAVSPKSSVTSWLCCLWCVCVALKTDRGHSNIERVELKTTVW